VGADVNLTRWSTLPLRALLFGEAQGRVVLSTREAATVLDIARKYGVPAERIGHVRAGSLRLRIQVADETIDASIETLADAYHEAIPRLMNRSAAPVEVAMSATGSP
jgi:phosphoribosylformylglycinamidine synthase